MTLGAEGKAGTTLIMSPTNDYLKQFSGRAR
jgi:hypothetical protein